jgi:hypothetical protein
MKYPEITGICKIAIRNNLCNGCNKLEEYNFRGQADCDMVQKPREKIKNILGIGEQMRL